MFLFYASVALAVDFTIAGSCPGFLEMEFTSLPDDGQIFVMVGPGAGEDVIPVGPCVGTSSGLAGPLRPVGRLVSDMDPSIVFDVSLPSGACDMWMSVATTSCSVTLAAPVSGDTCEAVCARARVAGCATMVDCESDCENDIDRCPDEMNAVLQCHTANPIMCSLVEDNGIGQDGCEAEHDALLDICDIDAF